MKSSEYAGYLNRESVQTGRILHHNYVVRFAITKPAFGKCSSNIACALSVFHASYVDCTGTENSLIK